MIFYYCNWFKDALYILLYDINAKLDYKILIISVIHFSISYDKFIKFGILVNMI